MRRWIPGLLGLLIAAGPVFAGEVIVRLAEGVEVATRTAPSDPLLSNSPRIQQALEKYAPSRIRPLFTRYRNRLPEPLRRVQVWDIGSPEQAERAVRELTDLPEVIYAEPNRAFRITQTGVTPPDDPDFGQQWYLSMIGAPQAWQITRGSAQVIVGVIDTGVDYDHEDLRGQLWINAAEDLNNNGVRDSLDFNGIDEDGNGYVDDVIGWDFTDAPHFPDGGDFLDPDNDPMDEFGSGHGTPVAGIIAAAQNNGRGISGIAPGVRVMVLRAGTASGFLEEDDVAEAILYAVENGCRVVNMSFGDVAVSYLLRDAIRYGVSRDVVFVAAAGNGGDTTPNYPAAFEETISVSAVAEDGSLAPFSSYGSTIDLAAPGQDIYAPLIGDQYGAVNGTSFAAPVVSAVLALIRSQFPHWSAGQVKGALLAGTTEAGVFGWDIFFGHGIVNAYRSLIGGQQGFAEILYPEANGGTAADTVAIVGTAFSPNLRGYRLFYGVGETPGEYVPIAEVFGEQVVRDTLALWQTTGLPDTGYTLELRLEQVGAPEVVRHVSFTLDHTPPQLLELDTIPLLIGLYSGYLIHFRSDDHTLARLHFGFPNLLPPFLFRTSRYFHREHWFILSQQDITGAVIFYIELENAPGLSTRWDNQGAFYPLNLTGGFSSEGILFQTALHPFQGFFLPFATDFDGDGSREIVISELLEGGRFGPLKIMEFSGGQFLSRMETEFAAIPRDVGDIQGNGSLQLLAGAGSASLLLGGNGPGEFPQQVVWFDTVDFWGSRLVNLDADPALEMLALNFGRWKIFDITPDYQVTEQQVLADTTAGNNIFGVPRALVADTDGDGRREIIVGDVDSDLYVYEEDGAGRYQFVWSVRLPGEGGSSLYEAADVTGDGLPEILALVRNEPSELRESNINAPYWALTVWQATADNTYEMIWQQNFQGITVRSGIYNALNAADLTGDGIAEIIVCPFPEVYVFQYDNGKFQLRWFQEGVNTGAAAVADFEGNGRNDMLVNTPEGVMQLEFAGDPGRPLPPTQLQATPLDTRSISLRWAETPGAAVYRIYRRRGHTAFTLLDSTSLPHYLDTAVVRDTLYTYAVTQVNPAFPSPESPLSAPASARPNEPPQVIGLEVLAPRQIRIDFSEPMSPDAFENHHYELVGEKNRPGSVIRRRGSRSALLVLLEPLTPGQHTLLIGDIRDLDGTPFPDGYVASAFQYPGAPEAFYLQGVEFISKTHLRITFNHAVEVASAEQVEHYALEPDDAVISARVDAADPRQVDLFLSGRNRMGSLGVPYYLTVRGVRDTAGQLLDTTAANRLLITVAVENLDNLVVYPNPYHADRATQPLRFGNIPRGAEIRIFTATGVPVRRLKAEEAFGGVIWNLRTDQGHPVGSGVYIFIARHGEQEKRGKILVVR